MTVSSQVSSVSYLGDGVTTLLPVPYYFLEQTHLLVTRVNVDTSTSTLILGSDYSVTGAGNQAGGSITMFVAPAVGVQIIIERNVPATQETDYVANDPFPAESHERALDKLTMLVQQNSNTLGRALLRPLGKNYYDAQGRQIKNLADPTSDQDAATKKWASDYIAQILATGQGPVNNAANVIYLETPKPVPDGTVASAIQYNPLRSNIDLLIPTDFPDLQSAMNYCSRKRGSEGFSINVIVESGYVIRKGYRVDDVDLSHVILKSVDPTVTVSADFEHMITYDLQAGVARGNFFSFVHVRSKAPRWNILIDHSGAETDGGYCLYWGRGVVYNFGGVDNAKHDTGVGGEGGAGFKVGGASHLIAPYGLGRGCDIGFALTQSTVGDLQFADAQNATLTGIDVSRGSMVYALNSNVNGALREGFYIRRSRVICEAAIITNTPIGIRAQATADVSAVNAVFDGTPIAVARGSFASVEITGATKGGVQLDTLPTSLSPQNINRLDQAGMTVSLGQRPGSAGQLTAIYPAASASGGSVSAPPNTYTTIQEITGSQREILGGSISGDNIGMRITIDGVVVKQFVAATGGGPITLIIPPFASLNTYKVEVFNRDLSVTKTVAWQIDRRI